MRLLTLLIALLVLSGAAAAQPGPQPGYASATDYAQAYAEERVGNASEDPEGFAAGYASPEALKAEAEHTAYVACWAADDAGLEPAACDPFYTPRGEAMPERPEEAQEVEAFEDSVINATDSFADAAVGVVNDTVADPASAPSQVERLLDATQGFLGSIGDAAAALADALAGSVLAILDGLVAAVDGLEAIGVATSQALSGALEAVGDAFGSTAAVSTDALVAGGVAIADGLGAFGHAIGSAAAATGHGIADAGRSVGQAIADAAGSVADGVADAARAVKDTVAGWFGAEPASDSLLQSGLKAPGDVDASASGLLDGVTGLVA